jgi:GNAT superfamily N-acetyltransferase
VALVIEALDEATFERAAALVAREQAAARQVRPELPAGFGDAAACAAALRHLCVSGHHGLVATSGGHAVAVMTVTVRETPTVSRYARLPAEGFAVDPDLADPTGVLAAVFADLASPLVADGVRRYYLLHAALPRLSEALSNLGFGRNGAYGVQPAAPRPRSRSPVVTVRVAGPEDFDTVARLALVEVQHRSAPPMFGPAQGRPLAELAAEHRALRDNGAVHLLAALRGADVAAIRGADVAAIRGADVAAIRGDDVAALGGADVGLLTIELTSPVPRLCPDGQPYIGPTATVPAARGRGVGHALVDAALTWAHDHGHQWVSVDFETANPLSRPFWLNAGFRPTGYGVFRVIEPRR